MATRILSLNGVVKLVNGSVLVITPTHGALHGPQGDITTNTGVPGGAGLTPLQKIAFDVDVTFAGPNDKTGTVTVVAIRT